MKIKYLECECGYRIYPNKEVPEECTSDWVRWGMDGSKEVYKHTAICPECESESFSVVLWEREFD